MGYRLRPRGENPIRSMKCMSRQKIYIYFLILLRISVSEDGMRLKRTHLCHLLPSLTGMLSGISKRFGHSQERTCERFGLSCDRFGFSCDMFGLPCHRRCRQQKSSYLVLLEMLCHSQV